MDQHPVPPEGQPQNDRTRIMWSERAPLTGQFEISTTRRNALLWLIRIGLAAFALAFFIPAFALKTLRVTSKVIAPGDELVYAQGDAEGEAVNAKNLKEGTAVHAFPKEKSSDPDNLVELVHLQDSPEIVAFSAICTHLGCTVLTTLTNEGDIPCPCHGSVFNPAKDAEVIAGPAPRALPSLPIKVQDDGTVVVTGDFSGKIGPD